MALAAVRSKTVVLLLLIRSWLLLQLWYSVNDSVNVLCFAVCFYFVSILDLQAFRWGSESWLICFVCLPGVLWLLCGSSSRYHGFVCSLWLWYFLIILTYNFLFKIWSKYKNVVKYGQRNNSVVKYGQRNHPVVKHG